MTNPRDHRVPSGSLTPNSPLRIGSYEGASREWDGLVLKAPGGTHAHRLGWRRVMERSLGHSCHYLGAWDASGRLVGLNPLVYVGSPLFGKYVISMPFLNYGGPLGSDVAVAALAEAALQEGKRRGARLVELRSLVPLRLAWPVSHRKVTVILDLPDDPDILFASFQAKLRSQIRRPGKEGVEVLFGPEHLSAFYSVFARHMRDLGTPVHSMHFFREILAEFSDSVRLAVAFLRGEPVAGGWGFVWDDELELTWASSLLEHKRTAANMLVYWEFMRRAIEEGLARFNFGRCTPGSGTHQFKLQWGGKELPLYWYQAAKNPNVRTPSPDDPSLAWGPRLWKRMPLWIASRLGPPIVRLIP